MDELKSKSQKKREADALQTLGIELIGLSVEKLALLPLTPALEAAIMTAKLLKSHGAIRRQAQLIGKLMRSADSEAISASYAQLTADNRAQSASFHEMERWRDTLLSGDKSALTEFIHRYQPREVQTLRQLLTKALAEKALGEKVAAKRLLFRFIRTCFDDASERMVDDLNAGEVSE